MKNARDMKNQGFAKSRIIKTLSNEFSNKYFIESSSSIISSFTAY
jgi:hypothetical protein